MKKRGGKELLVYQLSLHERGETHLKLQGRNEQDGGLGGKKTPALGERRGHVLIWTFRSG